LCGSDRELAVTPELCIRRLSASYRLPLEDVDVAARLDRVFTRVARDELVRSAVESEIEQGDWCVRRLDVTVPVRLTDTDLSIARQWSSSLVAAVRQLIGSGSTELVHYSRRRDALVELVSDTASGRPDRAWAWEQIGVRSPGDPSPWHAPVDAILVALCRAPHEVLPVIATACHRIGLPALDRILGPDGWIAIIEIVAGVANADASARRIVGGALPGDVPGAEDTDDVQAHRRLSDKSAASRWVAQAVLSSSSIFEHVRRSRLRPDAIRSWAWAVLASVEADPSIARRRDRDEILSVVALAIAGVGNAAPGGGVGADDVAPGTVDRSVSADLAWRAPTRRMIGAGSRTDIARSTAGTRPGRAEADPEAVAAGVEGDVSFDRGTATTATAWAGLMFLLNVMADGDLIEELIDADELVNRTIRWVLHALARELLPLRPSDPAALAFAGLDPSAPAPSTGVLPPTPEELSRLQRLGKRSAAAFAERLGRNENDARAVIEHVAARHGEIEAEPGWIDVHLRLDEVDLDVRTAGLDFDPGWIPWLGSVVRFVYDR
jgi:hypothetical protein